MSNVFRTITAAIFGPARTRKVRKTTRRVGLNVENLGERVLLSVSPIHAVAIETPIADWHIIPHGPDVPELQGYTFHLTSSNGKPAHTLVITSETYMWSGSASFTGTWSGDGPNAKTVSGTMVFAANSHTVTSVNFSWTNGSNEQNSFSGNLTPGAPATSYYLTGQVTSPSGGGPGRVSGYGYPPHHGVTGHL